MSNMLIKLVTTFINLSISLSVSVVLTVMYPSNKLPTDSTYPLSDHFEENLDKAVRDLMMEEDLDNK